MYISFMNKSSLYKGCLEHFVLRLLDNQKRMYGYELTQKVKELTAGDLVITEGALYPLLHRLEAEGLLDSEIKIVDNRPRKYYFLTPKGKKNAPQAATELKRFLENIQSILQPKTSLG